jgi:ABC-2 type transport system permease protein
MSTTAAPTEGLLEIRPARRAAVTAFWVLLLRDLTVLRKTFIAFALRTILQPVLLVFVFTYVFPKIGQGIGGSRGSEAIFSTLLIPGVVATSVIFQGIQSVALPLVQEFGYTREIDDRIMAPLPVWAVAVGKIAAGSVQGMVAAAIVFPLAAIIPATPVHLSVNWHLIPMLVLSTALGATLGLTIGTRAAPQQVPLVFGIIVIPITFLGATYYPWVSLTPIAWLKWFVLTNPLVYMSEGYRLALTKGIPTMPALAIYGALIGFTALLAWLGIAGFRKRVLT